MEPIENNMPLAQTKEHMANHVTQVISQPMPLPKDSGTNLQQYGHLRPSSPDVHNDLAKLVC